MTLAGSLAVLTVVAGAAAWSVYFLIAIATSAHVVPRSSHELRLLGSLSLVIGGFAVVAAARDELRARRGDVNETPELSPAPRSS